VKDTDGNYVREIRIVGNVDSNYPSAPVVFTLRITSPVQANVAVSTPNLTF
jgi:hypothetical protein